MATRFCPNCGQPIQDNSKFCTNCGASIPTPNETQYHSFTEEPPQPTPQSNSKPFVPKPSNYLALAILATIFCCLPFGIPAIVFAAKVDNLWVSGDYQGAEEASRKAKRWVWVSVITGVVVGIIYTVLSILGMNFLQNFNFDY